MLKQFGIVLNSNVIINYTKNSFNNYDVNKQTKMLLKLERLS